MRNWPSFDGRSYCARTRCPLIQANHEVSIGLLEFEIDSQRYALPLEDVVEVVRAVAVTRLPAGPSIVDGIIDVRGDIVPVLDLRTRFRHPARTLDPSEHFIIARAGRRVVAMRADHAIGVSYVSAADIEAIDSSIARSRFVAGVAKTADGVVLIHHVGDFLSESESEALDRALAGAEIVLP
jgi:purine-binding chemotaxis protein CheW